MKIQDLQDGQVVTVRTARVGGADEEGPKWSDWYQAALGVQRTPKGEIAILTLGMRVWAEYSPKHDYEGKGLFLCEGYYMEIKGLDNDL